MKSPLMRAASVLLLAGSVALMGCADADRGADLEADTTAMDTTDGLGMDDMQETATAELQPTEGYNATGTATFTATDGTVRIVATVSGLTPGMHGIHVHENGDCSAPDASSAGGHFAPEGNPHGAPDDAERHVGDLGNIEVGSDSTGTYSRTDSLITLSGPNSIVGKALIVHSGEDDLTSQPSGNAGERVACGVIEFDGGMDGMMDMDADTAGGLNPMGADTMGDM